MKDKKSSGNHESSFIARDLVFKGSIEAGEDIHIAGQITGDIRVRNRITLDTSAKLKGNIEAKNVNIAGAHVEGEINASTSVVLSEAAHFRGTLRTANLVTEKGIVINGTVEMKSQSDQPNVSKNSPTSSHTPSDTTRSGATLDQ